ncbi:hypothetical protein HFN51_04200 [Rhizobium leguminosarum]|nr:hypothetical protein [Rhizobium leguminosarum]
MKKLLSAAAAVVLLAAPAEAGYRSSGGGFRSSGSRSFSRSYSAPRPSYTPRSYSSSRNTTVIQNHNYGGGGSGMGSGMFWGYLLGQSMNHPAPAPAAPSVVVVPQGATPAAPVYPNVSTVAPIAPEMTTVIEPAAEVDEGGLGLFGWLLVILGLGGAGWWTLRFMNRRAIA